MLNQVRYFQAVVRYGNFTEAAEECHISQSAISQQIKVLEQELGVQLFEQHNKIPVVSLLQYKAQILI